MSFVALCTFDLKNASSQDYANAYSDLSKLGMNKVQANSIGGNTVIPTTTVLGEYNGVNAAQVRDAVRDAVKGTFAARGLKSEIFVVVGGEDWNWGAAIT